MMKDTLKIIITVDVEASMYKYRPLPVEKMVYGEFHNERFGISKIMDICDQFGFKASFFVDVFSYKHYGSNILKEICMEIKDRGHDLQLHTHPAWLTGRFWMFEHSLNEQIELIKKGKELLHKWTGEYPIAHRAGGYSADANTIRALSENQIPVDSSMFAGYSLCKLKNGVINRVFERDMVIEIPVTTFTPLKFGSFKKYRSLDIDSCTLNELKFVTVELTRKNVKTATLFLHSFSFIKWNEDRTEFYPDLKDLKRFRDILNFASKRDDIEVITVKEFYDLYKECPKAFIGSDFVPHSGIVRTYIRAIQRFNQGWKNRVFIVSSFLVLLITLALVFHFTYRVAIKF